MLFKNCILSLSEAISSCDDDALLEVEKEHIITR